MLHKLRSVQILIWLFLLFLPHASVYGADSTSFDPTKVAVEAKSSGGVPVGTIISWPVATNPEDMDNWLECNGQNISPSVYPELYALMGGRTPDLRGLFLRGHGGNSAALGVRQEDAFKAHSHDFLGHGVLYGGVENSYRAVLQWTETRRTEPTGDIETRPVNMATRYLIRAKP